MLGNPLTRIMVPVDFSEVSAPLVEYAGRLASRYGSEVVLIHVIEEGIVEHVASGYNVEALVRDLEEHARSRMEELADILRGSGVSVTIYPEMPIGDPAAVISHIAGEEGVSEVLIASKGWGIKRLIPLGSTARLLIKLSPVPVIRLKAVKADDRVDLLGATEDLFNRMLVAVKPGYGEALRDYLPALAEKVKPEITLVYIEEEEHSMDFARELEDVLKARGASVSSMMLSGKPYQRIIEAAEHLEASIVVIERSVREGLRELFMGSTMVNLANKLNKPLMVLPR